MKGQLGHEAVSNIFFSNRLYAQNPLGTEYLLTHLQHAQWSMIFMRYIC